MLTYYVVFTYISLHLVFTYLPTSDSQNVLLYMTCIRSGFSCWWRPLDPFRCTYHPYFLKGVDLWSGGRLCSDKFGGNGRYLTGVNSVVTVNVSPVCRFTYHDPSFGYNVIPFLKRCNPSGPPYLRVSNSPLPNYMPSSMVSWQVIPHTFL